MDRYHAGINGYCIDKPGLMDNTYAYRTITSFAEGIYSDKGSKFIGYLAPITSEEEFKKYLKELQSKHSGARHFCSAYRIGKNTILERSNDDGEPSGTAGKPILNQLLSAQITEVCLIVVRYFGGTLLGTTGLIQAYKGAAIAAIDKAIIVEREITSVQKFIIPYSVYNDFMNMVKKYSIKAEMVNSTEQESIFIIEIPLRIENDIVDEIHKITSHEDQNGH